MFAVCCTLILHFVSCCIAIDASPAGHPVLVENFTYWTMAAQSTGGGISLKEYRKDVPPGWMPGQPDYPLTLFFEKLKIWYRIYDGPDEAVGPLVAGRL